MGKEAEGEETQSSDGLVALIFRFLVARYGSQSLFTTAIMTSMMA